jgi:hypothetical protein
VEDSVSVAICYSTTKPVSRQLCERLRAEAEHVDSLSWYEPIHLVCDDDDPAVPRGWSKCAPLSLERDDGTVLQIAEHDWFFMDYWDFRRLLEQFARWSSEHGLVWVLDVEGRRLGKVGAGRPSWGLRRYLAAAARRGRATGDPERDAARAEHLRQKYPFGG